MPTFQCEARQPLDKIVQDRQKEHHSMMDKFDRVLQKMKRLENSDYRTPLAMPAPFDGIWRQQIVEWMYTVINHCKLRHEAATAAVFFLDSAVARGLIETADNYQLGAMTALYLGLKIFDSPSMRVVKLGSLVKLGNGDFGEADIVKMERQMLKLFQWKMSPPTADCFVQIYLELLPKDIDEAILKQIEKGALEVIELGMAHDTTRASRPSIMGYAAMLAALDQMPRNSISIAQLREYLHAMERIAGLDNGNPTLHHISIALDRIKHNSATPETCQFEHTDDLSSESITSEKGCAVSSPSCIGSNRIQ